MKIIIVDDELSALHAFLDEVIGERDIEYKFFRDDKAEIEEYVSANRVEAAFLDINMPGINGMDLAAHLIGIRGDIKIVFITAQKVGVQDLDELVRKHTIGFVYKPYNKTVLDNYFCVLRHLAPELTVKMFGSFDCFVNGNIVTFTSKKSKELFALLLAYNGKPFDDGSHFPALAGYAAGKEQKTVPRCGLQTAQDAGSGALYLRAVRAGAARFEQGEHLLRLLGLPGKRQGGLQRRIFKELRLERQLSARSGQAKGIKKRGENAAL